MLPVIWDRRTRLVLVASQWVALALGIFASFATEGPQPITIGAAGIAGVFVLGSTSAPPDWFRRQLVLDIWVLGWCRPGHDRGHSDRVGRQPISAVGNYTDPLGGDLRKSTPGVVDGSVGFGASAADRVGSRRTRTGPGVLLVGGIQLLLAISISQVGECWSIWSGVRSKWSSARKPATGGLEQLEDTHDLLTRLEELTASQDTNPIKLGKTALESLVARFPGTAAAAAIASDKGPVLVARVGNEPPQSQRLTIPLRLAGQETGWIMLATPRTLSQAEIDGIEQSMRPLALAFSNVRLLEMIAQKAISEERVRIARELHDELGPSLASLGLGIDLAMVQNTPDQPLTDQLTQLRRSVSFLVDDIRKTVADLRSEPEPSLSTSLNEHLIKLDPDPDVQLDIDERRPPRPSIAQELTAIVSEAIRNASRHANARSIKVSGVVDFDRGWISIADDGRGFDKTQVPDGHYGLIGMKERAAKIGGRLDVESGPRGTVDLNRVEPQMIRVMIADDHQLFAEGLSEGLTAIPDLRVVGVVSNGSELLDRLKSQPADVLLIDLEMPGLDGMGTLAALPSSAKAIVVSMHDNEQTRQAVAKAGAMGMFSKGVPLLDIAAAIRAVADGELWSPACPCPKGIADQLSIRGRRP